MFYDLSKPLWFLATPSNALVVAGLVGVLFAFSKHPRGTWFGRRLGLGAMLLLLICGVGPVGYALMLPLEQRFPPMVADAPAPDGIIVLGGAVEERITLERHGGLELNEAAERFTTLLMLARRYPQAKLLFSGGTGRYLSHAPVSEAAMVGAHVASFGLDPSRLMLETRSRNTAENARFSAAMLRPQPGQVWWLVTSAFHMPRAVGAFRKAGFTVQAWPVDYRTAGPGDLWRPSASVSEGLRRTDVAVKEWLGLVAYRLAGRTNALFPAP